MRDTYSFTLTAEQFAKAVLHRTRKRIPSGAYRFGAAVASTIFIGAAAFLLVVADNRHSVPASVVTWAVLAMLGSALVAQFVALAGTRKALLRSRHMIGQRQLCIEPEGIRQTSRGSDVFLRWEELSGVDVEADVLYLGLDAVSFYPVPSGAFGSPEEMRQFAEFVRQRIGRAGEHPPQPALPPEADAPQPAMTRAYERQRPASARHALIGAMSDSARLAFLRPLPEGRPSGGWAAVFTMALASMGVPVLAAFLSVGVHGQWNWFMLSSALMHVPLLLGAAIVAAYAIGRPPEVPRFLMAALLASFAIDIVTGVAGALVGSEPAWLRLESQYHWIPSAWLAVALATFIGRSAGSAVRRLVVVGCCIVLVALPLGNIYRDRSLWHRPYVPDEDSPAEPARGPAGEDVLYKQPTLLSQELRSVRPAFAGATNVFFIGMAGYGSQDVFRREVESVTRLFRERFDADGHTIRLINNSKTLLDVPIASKTSLRAALKRVSEVMDKDRDVLVLYMTSHGSEDHRFSLSLWPMAFHEIDPKTLRSLLDESGIRNRVVIISACYSGGFVKPLESPDTLVITASASDRNSFGCSNEADWTYFGKAYFDEALRRTHSFTKAFELAKPRIAERERHDEFDPSNPQIAVGSRIAVKLDALEKQLDGAGNQGARITVAARTADALDKYDEYVSMMFTADYLEDMRSACGASMEMVGPEQTLASRPNSFGGMERSPRHWRKLTAAWDRYAKQVCGKGYDVDVVRGIYSAKLRALMGERDLEPAIEFLRSPRGARWIRLEREATREESIELARMQSELSNTLYEKYLEEQGAIFEDFRKNGR